MNHHHYIITTGTWNLVDDDGSETFLGKGWAGNNEVGQDMNNPADEGVKDHGPTVEGGYTIGPVIDPPDHLGKLAMHLIPDPGNDMQGRGSFCVHGAESLHPEQSSDGCIIQGHDVRQQIANWVAQGVDHLEVTAS